MQGILKPTMVLVVALGLSWGGSAVAHTISGNERSAEATALSRSLQARAKRAISRTPTADRASKAAQRAVATRRAGARGPTGPTGPQGGAGAAGPSGVAAAPGSSAYASLASGTTLTGVWGGRVPRVSTGGVRRFFVPLPVPASTPLSSQDVGFGSEPLSSDDLPNACRGTLDAPMALPGFVCLYLGQSFGLLNVTDMVGASLTTDPLSPINTTGFAIDVATTLNPQAPKKCWPSPGPGLTPRHDLPPQTHRVRPRPRVFARRGPDGDRIGTVRQAGRDRTPEGEQVRHRPLDDGAEAARAQPRGPTGRTGAPGTAGIDGAPGAPGQTGAHGSTAYSSPIPTGRTLTGAWGGLFANPGAGIEIVLPVGLPARAPIALGDGNVQVGAGTPGGSDIDTIACPGSFVDPKAAPGFACIYPKNSTAKVGSVEGIAFSPSPTRGFAVRLTAPDVTNTRAGAVGTWAYTAP